MITHKHFKTKSGFQAALGAGQVLDTDLCFVKETGEIWTHGRFFGSQGVITKDTLGLGAVDNTADIDKPMSKAVKEVIEANEEVVAIALRAIQGAIGLTGTFEVPTDFGSGTLIQAIKDSRKGVSLKYPGQGSNGKLTLGPGDLNVFSTPLTGALELSLIPWSASSPKPFRARFKAGTGFDLTLPTYLWWIGEKPVFEVGSTYFLEAWGDMVRVTKLTK